MANPESETGTGTGTGRRLRDLHVKDMIAKEGAQLFAGLNNGTISFAVSEKSQESPTEAIKKCQEALFITNPRNDREDLVFTKGARQPQTCEWIRDNSTYQSWVQGDSQLLWISGSPGKGKTMLSIFLTEDLEATNTLDAQVLYYFCSHQDERRNNAVHILRGLLWQMTCAPELRDRVLGHFSAEEKNSQTLLSSRESLWRLFSAIVQDPAVGAIYCVLDGLDECDEESTRWLVARFKELFSTAKLKQLLRIAIVSREFPNMIALARTTKCARIELDSDHDEQVSDDVVKFVAASVREFAWMEGFNPQVENEIQTVLLERANSTFLWAGCVVTELKNETTCTGVIHKLHSFPDGLDAIYRRMLGQIVERERRQQASLILRWVASAVSPLSLAELGAAIQSQPIAGTHKRLHGKQLTVIELRQVVRDQVKMCGSMLEIHGETVVLVHKSAREFLMRDDPDMDPILEDFRINPAEAHLHIALTCLEYIKQSPLKQTALTPKSVQQWEQFPLLRYATVHWLHHARLSTSQGRGLFGSSSFFFEKDSRVRENWWKTYAACVRGQGKEWGRALTIVGHRALRWKAEKLSDRLRGIELKIQRELNEKVLPPLHMASRFGLLEWVRALLEARKRDRTLSKAINAVDENGLDPLTWAAMEGHAKVVELLLEYNADSNATTALLRKSALSMMPSRFLNSYLREATDGDSMWTGNHTVLYRAAYRGHAAVVKSLLERGADPNLSGWADHKALHAVAMTGSEEVARLLLLHGAHKTVNAQLSVTLITPLQYAVEADNYSVARMLLEKKAEINSVQRHSGYAALHCAIAEDASTKLVQLLLDNHAKIELPSMSNDTPLHLSAIYARDSTIALLLERGANIHARNGWNGNTALHMAAKTFGRSSALEVLLKCGADIHAKNTEGKTALHFAASTDISSVRLLLDHGANVHAKKGNGGTPLHSAAKKGDSEMIRILLERGADAGASNNIGESILSKVPSTQDEASREARRLLQSPGTVQGLSHPLMENKKSEKHSVDDDGEDLPRSHSEPSVSPAEETPVKMDEPLADEATSPGDRKLVESDGSLPEAIPHIDNNAGQNDETLLARKSLDDEQATKTADTGPEDVTSQRNDTIVTPDETSPDDRPTQKRQSIVD